MTKFPFYPPDVANRFEQSAAEFAFEQADPTPWTPLRRALHDCKVVLVTTAGIRLKTQHEFAADRVNGSADWREISLYATRDSFAFDLTGYDATEAEQDINVLAPVDPLKELVEQGTISLVNETFFSFFGACRDVNALKASASAVAAKMKDIYEVDVCFLFPATFFCNQTAGILSREFEKAGLSTVTLTTVKEIAQQIHVPRPLFINFPFGRTLGPAHAGELQRSIINDMVRVLKTHDRPDRLVELPYKWHGTLE